MERKSEAPIKLTILLQDLEFGGSQRYAVNLLKHLDRRLFAPELWVLRGGTDMVHLAMEANTKIVWLSKASWVPPRVLIHLFFRLVRHRPDILYTITVAPNIWGRLFKKIIRIPIIVTSYRNQNPLQYETWLCRLSNRIICNANMLKKEILAAFSIHPDRVAVVPNAVDTDYFVPANGLKAPEPTVLYVGRLVKGKDPETLIQAFKIVTKELPHARLQMVGNGPLKKKLTRLIRSLSLESAVRLIPGSGDTRPYLKKAWVFAMSSIREGSPNVILEAMASGLPVVATSAGGISELVVQDRTGAVVAQRDPQGLARALIDILRHEPKRHAMEFEARQRVLAEYTMEKMVRQTEKVLMDAVREVKNRNMRDRRGVV